MLWCDALVGVRVRYDELRRITTRNPLADCRRLSGDYVVLVQW